MMPSHMRKIIWLSLFYALYFLWHVACGMWHDVICPGGRERYFPDFVFPFHHLLPPASSYSSIIHLSLSPHQKMPCKNSGPDVTPEPNNVTLLNQPEIYKTNIKSFTIPLFSWFQSLLKCTRNLTSHSCSLRTIAFASATTNVNVINILTGNQSPVSLPISVEVVVWTKIREG